MRNRLLLGAVAALLACSAGTTAAHTSVGIGIGIGFPGYVYPGYGYPGYAVPVLPYGGVGFSYYGGYYGGWGPYGRYGGYGYRPWGAQVLVAPPPPVGYAVQTAPPPAERLAAPARPDPVIYPRNGQDGTQTEYDRQQCNRWATTQPAAVADASVFQRAIQACMDARGYTVK